MGGASNIMPIVSKTFCSSLQTTLMIRKRPRNVNGGGFVVMNPNHQHAIFIVDGCGMLGIDGKLVVKDGEENPILIIQKKGGLVQALSVNNYWRGRIMNYQVPSKIVFSLQEPKSRIFVNNHIRICMEPKEHKGAWDFEVQGSFLKKACTINDRRGNVVAEVGVKEVMAMAMASKELYHVVVQPGYDQAFVVGVIAILDYIHGESTRC